MVCRRERWTLWMGVVVGVATLVTGIALIRRLRGTARAMPADSDDGTDWLAAREYERLTGIAKEPYERRLLAEAQSSMMGEWAVEPTDGPAYTRVGVLERGSVDDVRLEGNGTEAALVVRFRSNDRPGCVFGWRIPIWPVPAPDDPEMGTPEGHASILSLDLVELVEAAPGLPTCDPDAQGVTWVVNRVRTDVAHICRSILWRSAQNTATERHRLRGHSPRTDRRIWVTSPRLRRVAG